MKVYCIENIINGKKYIGVTKRSVEQRFKAHKRTALNKNSKKCHIHDAMLKYGIQHFEIKEIDSATSTEELFEKEKYWIKQLDTKNTGYNETDGGEGCFGWKATNQQKLENKTRNIERNKDPKYREFVSNKTKEAMKNLPQETRKRMSDFAKERLKGNQHCKGKTWILSEQNKENISKAKMGTKFSEESKQKMKLAKSGINNPSAGSMWITNDIKSKKIYHNLEIPEGWHQGRAFKKRKPKT